jgi:hypothetical protein
MMEVKVVNDKKSTQKLDSKVKGFVTEEKEGLWRMNKTMKSWAAWARAAVPSLHRLPWWLKPHDA